MHPATSTLIAAVADGVSGARQSDLGAALAVRYATAAVARQLEEGEIDWPGVFEQAAWALVSEGRRMEQDPRALATTLVVAAVSVGDEVSVQVAAVGDSPALRLHARTYDPVVDPRPSEDGLIGGGVAALPRDARDVLAGSCALGRGDALLLCTDGVALPLAGGQGELARTLARELGTPPDVVDFARLLDFSRSTYDDDRTLIAVWAPR
jgi:serine/threonine protein phosphatase PrpC